MMVKTHSYVMRDIILPNKEDRVAHIISEEYEYVGQDIILEDLSYKKPGTVIEHEDDLSGLIYSRQNVRDRLFTDIQNIGRKFLVKSEAILRL